MSIFCIFCHRNFNFQSLIILKMPFLLFNFLFPLSPLCFLHTSCPSFLTPYPFLLLHLLSSSLTQSYPPSLSRSFFSLFLSLSLFSVRSFLFLFPRSSFSLFITFCLSSCFLILNSLRFSVLPAINHHTCTYQDILVSCKQHRHIRSHQRQPPHRLFPRHHPHASPGVLYQDLVLSVHHQLKIVKPI